MARIKFTDREAWYHLHCRVSARRGEFPLADSASTRRLIETIEHFSPVYFCDVAAFTVMGNHYHLVVKFDGERGVDREELRARTRIMYPSMAAQAQINDWSDEQWEHYRKRLFDVAEFMRNIQMAYARWYNRAYDRHGRFWADRYKSVILGDEEAVLDCILYVELNSVRAGLVERPEDWQGSSIFLREIAKDGWLMPLRSIVNRSSRKKALTEFRQLLYYRGAVPTKEGQAAISEEILEREIVRGFSSSGFYRKRLRYFVDGLAVGTEEFIRDQLNRMREEGRYRRRRNAIPQLGGIHLSLREQRGPRSTSERGDHHRKPNEKQPSPVVVWAERASEGVVRLKDGDFPMTSGEPGSW
jgi:REP element-mobilizing transposase RayT